MRELTTGTNVHTTVAAVDEPSHGGACHVYEIINTLKADADETVMGFHQLVEFQKGPVKEHGVNGITEENLLCILIDRLEGFQSGEYACQEYALALTYLQGALGRLNDRTKRRQKAGIEGTSALDYTEGLGQNVATSQPLTPQIEEADKKDPVSVRNPMDFSYALSDDKLGLKAFPTQSKYVNIHSDEMTEWEIKRHKALLENEERVRIWAKAQKDPMCDQAQAKADEQNKPEPEKT